MKEGNREERREREEGIVQEKDRMRKRRNTERRITKACVVI